MASLPPAGVRDSLGPTAPIDPTSRKDYFVRHPLMALLVPVVLLLGGTVRAQEAGKAAPKVTVIRAGKLFDARAGKMLEGRAILVEGERIKAVGPTDEVVKAAPKDARSSTCRGPPSCPA